MKLHGNAALSWNGRRQPVKRIVAEGGRSRRRPRRRRERPLRTEVGEPFPAARRARATRSRLVAAGGHQDAAGAGRGDHGAPPPAVHCGRDRRAARNGAVDRLGDSHQTRNGQTRPARPARRGPLRANAARRARPPTSRSSAGSRAGRANAYVRHTTALKPPPRDRAGRRRRSVGWEYVHIAVDVGRPRFGGHGDVRQLPLFLLL
jgi:hypothetical protein